MDHYTIFIEKVADAINQAMEVGIAEGVLADVLSKQKREGQNVVLTEFDQEKYDEMIKENGRIRTNSSRIKNLQFLKQVCIV